MLPTESGVYESPIIFGSVSTSDLDKRVHKTSKNTAPIALCCRVSDWSLATNRRNNHAGDHRWNTFTTLPIQVLP